MNTFLGRMDDDEDEKEEKGEKGPNKWTPLEQSLFESRIIQISGPVNSKLAHEVNKQLLAMEAKDADKPIFLFINSPGGEVTSGFSIYDTAKFIRPEIHTVVTGLAASMGSLIALCAEKKNRVSFPNAKFLIHQPLITGVLQGPASDLEIHARDIIRLKEKINRLYAEETGQPYDTVQKATDRDNWLDPEDALKFGLISRIIKKRSDLKI